MTHIKSGTVKYPAGKTFPNKFKPEQQQQTIVLSMDDGSEERLYFAAGRTPHSTLTKGSTVQLIYSEREGKTTRQLAIPQSAPSPTPQPDLSPEQKKMIASYVESQADLLAFCLDTANKKFTDKVQTEESIRTLAITLYINTQRQFNL